MTVYEYALIAPYNKRGAQIIIEIIFDVAFHALLVVRSSHVLILLQQYSTTRDILGIMKNKQTSAVVHFHSLVRSVVWSIALTYTLNFGSSHFIQSLIEFVIDAILALLALQIWHCIHGKFFHFCVRGAAGLCLWITNDTFVNQMERRLVEESLFFDG